MNAQRTKEMVSALYYALIMLVMPFYFENKYFNLTMAKARFLWVVGGILFLAMAACYIPGMVAMISQHRQTVITREYVKQKKEKRFTMLDVSILLFLCSAVCSGFACKTPREAFWGSGGWSMGILTIGILAAMYFAISRNIAFGKYMVRIAILSSSVLYVMGILNSFHIDVFGMHRGIANDFYTYISTIGNVNWYVGYLSILFPMGCLLYFNCREDWAKRLLFVYVNLGFYNVIICKSDGIILGLAASFFVVGLCIIQYRGFAQDFLKLLIGFSVVTGAVSLIMKFYHGQFIKIDGIFRFVIQKNLWLICGIAASLVLCFLKSGVCKKCRFKFTLTKKQQSMVFCAFFIVIALAVLFYEISVFQDSWGTGRGRLWICTYNLFVNFHWKYKLFGCGCDCFGIACLSKYFSHLGGVYLNAHNEFLQYLVTMGFFGLISYCMIWISAGRMFLQKRKKSVRDWMLFSAIMGYLGQSVVNNPQAFNYAVLFLALALFRKSIAAR
jgi:O-Antigen ligase.